MSKCGKRKERELAFQVLYGLSFSPVTDLEQLALAFQRSPHNSHANVEPRGRAWELTRGVWEKEKELDAAIEQYSHNWRAGRIGRIELILLRLALYEMLYREVPPKVVITECLDLSDQFGAAGAAAFMNGILDSAARARPAIATQLD